MPIDDALEKISVDEEEKPEDLNKPELSSIKIGAKEIIKEYVSSFAKHIFMVHGTNICFVENEKDYLFDYIKFDQELSLKVAKEMTRQELVDLLIANDGGLKPILENTDIACYIPEKFNILSEHVGRSMPAFLEAKELLNYENLKKLEQFSTNHFIIPDLKFISYFIEEGEKLRTYFESCSQDLGQKPFLLETNYLKNSVQCNFNIFTKSWLKDFYEKTGIRQIKKMMDEIIEISILANNTIDYVGTYGKRNKSRAINDLKNKLYLKLKKYHPELTVEGELKNSKIQYGGYNGYDLASSGDKLFSVENAEPIFDNPDGEIVLDHKDIPF